MNRKTGRSSKTILTIAFVMIALTAGRAWAQSEKALHFAHTEGAQNMNEITSLIRTLTDAPASLDSAGKTVKVTGSAEQLALAEWLFTQVDLPESANTPPSAVHEFVMKSGVDNTARVFFLPNTATVQVFQECAGAIRAITEIRRTFTANATRSLVVRGTPDAVALAAWMIDVFNASGDSSVPRDYRMPASADPRGDIAVRAFALHNAGTIPDFQEVAGALRAITEIRRIFTNNAQHLIFARSTPDALALAGWLLDRLDVAAGAKSAPGSDTYLYHAPPEPDTTVKVMYLPQSMSADDFQKFAARLRASTQIRRSCAVARNHTFSIRGSVNQIETADRIVKELDRPN